MIMWTYSSWPPVWILPFFLFSSGISSFSVALSWLHPATPARTERTKKLQAPFFFPLSLSLLFLFCDALLECNTTKRKKTKGNKRYTSAPTKLPTKKLTPKKKKENTSQAQKNNNNTASQRT
jgi:hypothetical protein